MTNYGYRLWAVDLHVGMKRERHQFGSAEVPLLDDDGQVREGHREVDYLKAVVADVKAKAGKTHNFGMTKGDDEGAGATAGTGASLRFTSANRVGNIMRLKVEYGLRHSDGTLIDPADDASDIPLKGRSTLHPYRAVLVTDPSAYRGLLAVETRGRACPMVSVVRGLRTISSDGFRLRAVSHVAGEAAMLDFISHSEVTRINFDQWGFTTDGAKTRREVSMGIVTNIEGQPIRNAVDRWCRTYFDLQREHVVDADVEAANEPDLSSLTADERKEYRRIQANERKAEKTKLKAERRLFGRQINHQEADTLKTTVFANREDDVTIDFTDVSVELLNGVPRTFSPLSDYQKLTYAIGTNLPSDSKFWKAAEETATKLLTGVQELPTS